MTETAQASAPLAPDKEALLHILADQMETLLWTTNAGLCVTSFVGGVPGHPLFGGDPVGRPVGELFGVRNPRAVPLEAHGRALRGETVAFDIERDGERYEAYVEPLRDGGGAVAGCVGVALRVSGPEAEPANGRGKRRRPAWGVAHDFNVLVSLIQGYSRLLMRQLRPGDPLRGALREIMRGSDRAAAVLKGDNG